MNQTGVVLFAIFLILVSDPVSGSAKEEPLAITVMPSSFNEAMLAYTPVSGLVVKGIALGSTGGLINPSSLYVSLPEKLNRRLGLTLSSRDGRYFAEAEYRLEDNPPGWFRLTLATGHARELKRYREDEMAAMVFLSSAATGEPELIFPSSWQVPALKNQITVFVNSGGTDVRVYDPKTDQYDDCSGTEGLSKTTYDTQCLVNVSDRSGEADFILLRNRFETPLKPIDLRIFFP